MPTPRRRDDPPDVDYAAQHRAEREEHDRDHAEAPTTDHTTPCAAFCAFREAFGTFKGIVATASGSVLLAVVAVAGNLWLRQDRAQDRMTASEVANASLTTEVRVELAAIKASQTRVETMLASIYRVTPANP